MSFGNEDFLLSPIILQSWHTRSTSILGPEMVWLTNNILANPSIDQSFIGTVHRLSSLVRSSVAETSGRLEALSTE